MCLYRLSTTLLETIESPVAKNATSRPIMCRSPSLSFARSATSECRSTSSTVQVFLMASRYRS